MSPVEAVPTTWDDTREDAFFRIVCHLLDAHWVAGASSLLAENDLEISAV